MRTQTSCRKQNFTSPFPTTIPTMLTNHDPHSRWQDDSAVRHRLSSSHPTSDDLNYGTWAERIIQSNHNSFGRRPHPDPKLGPWVRGIPRSYPCDVAGSPRALMIARSRKEMMDLVRSMPDEDDGAAAYELSLRDIVETPPPVKTPLEQEEAALMVEEKGRREENEEEKGERKEERSPRSGFLLKTCVPRVRAVLGGRRRFASGGGVGGVGKGAKVSPKPATDGESSERSSSSRSSNSGRGDCCQRRTWRKLMHALLKRDRRGSKEK